MSGRLAADRYCRKRSVESRGSLQINVFKPVARVLTIRHPQPAIRDSVVPPGISLAGLQKRSCARGQSRARDELRVDQLAFAVVVAIDVEPQVVRFKTCLPLEQCTVVIDARVE